MAIPSGLLGKGLFGLCLIGSGTTGFVFGKDIYFYFAKTDTKLSILGLPKDCKLGNEKSKECENINKDSLQKIFFKNKDGNKPLTVTGLDSGAIKIKVEKTNDTETFPYGLKFTIISEKDLEIKKSAEDVKNKIIVKKNTNTEFKINNRKLEKVWTVTTLAEKVGLTCPIVGEGNEKKCTAKKGTIKFSTDTTPTFKNLTLSADVSDKITYSENEAEYNQGFKFIVGSTAVTGTGAGSSSEQLEASTNYEVKFKEGNDGGWYLSKKTT